MSLSPSTSIHLLDLARLRHRTLLFFAAAALALAVSGYVVTRSGMPTWGGTLIFLGVMAVPVGLKWRDDFVAWGSAVMVLSVLLVLQGFHTVEHVVQAVQFYYLQRPGIGSQGLISSLNIEWVHFIWNWLAAAAVYSLFARGMRGVWGWLLLFWVTAHSLEHSYMLVKYIQMKGAVFGLTMDCFPVGQALPGVLGRDGWLATNYPISRLIPGLASLPRVMIHFNWNLGEMTLLFLAARASLPALLKVGQQIRVSRSAK